MGKDVFEIICNMNPNGVERQLAFQCAPVITGVKMSNLLMIQNHNINRVETLLGDSDIQLFRLYTADNKTSFLLYRRDRFQQYLQQEEVKRLLVKMGYQSLEESELLTEFQKRYAACRRGHMDFPHEMGMFLGYPIEDVLGFIEHKGKNYLYSGYWKVYSNIQEKRRLFKEFEQAKETLIRLLFSGTSMEDVIHLYHKNNELLRAAL